jgi:Flp pilus assembly protein TadB
MNHSSNPLKTGYSFSDFLFYICLLLVPTITALLAILKYSMWWAIAFGVLALGVTVLILRFYCTRCPHYTREGQTLKCIFFWGLPKFFNKRPGPLDAVDKGVTFSATALLLIFPLYWLLMEPGLLIVYALSLIGFGAAIYRNECKRCIYFACPANRVPAATRNPD